MVLCVKVALKEAEKVKQELITTGRFLEGYSYDKEANFIYFPVKEQFPGKEFVERKIAPTARKQDLKASLQNDLTKEELERLKRSFDTVGSIALIEIDESLTEKEKLIATTLLTQNKNIKTVLKKEGGHEGELRLQRYSYLAGEDTRETIVIENGVRLKINVEAVYYSVRSATERKRIASLVRPGEHILIMFSGAAPYPCVLAKMTEAAEITGIELNEAGHELGVESCKLNKLQNVVLIQGDVREVIPTFVEKGITFDRIVMPLPHTGHNFLEEAFAVSKKGTVIHLYDFEEEGAFEKGAEKILASAKRNGTKVKILKTTTCGQHSPSLYRLCIDFQIE